MSKKYPLWGYRTVSFIAIFAWLSYWLYNTRYSLLDDALIHLHYADYLFTTHSITFDGIHKSFGTSSLLYVSLLALLRSLTSSALLPKFVSDVGYLALIGLIIALIARIAHPLSRLLLVEMLVCLLSPMGIRWLTDGMETSLTVLLTVLFAMIVRNQQITRIKSILHYLLLVLFGAVLVYHRIELSMLIAIACFGIFAVKIAEKKSFGSAVFQASPTAVGAILAIGSIRIVFGSFLPDTALAKSGTASLMPALVAMHVLASSVLLGMGCLVCWTISLGLLIRRTIKSGHDLTADLLAIVFGNAAFFLVLALACQRGQNIQGVRYIIWPLIFSIVANSLQLASNKVEVPQASRFDSLERGTAILFFVLIACALPTDWSWAGKSMQGRAKTFLQMRDAHLENLFRDKTIVAGDVGFITYFTQSRTCDLNGLVNGRIMAAMAPGQRATYCAAQAPAMLFVSTGQAGYMANFLDLKDWSACGIADFVNVSNNDRHYLLVPPADVPATCQAFHSSPIKLADLGREQQ